MCVGATKLYYCHFKPSKEGSWRVVQLTGFHIYGMTGRGGDGTKTADRDGFKHHGASCLSAHGAPFPLVSRVFPCLLSSSIDVFPRGLVLSCPHASLFFFRPGARLAARRSYPCWAGASSAQTPVVMTLPSTSSASGPVGLSQPGVLAMARHAPITLPPLGR